MNATTTERIEIVNVCTCIDEESNDFDCYGMCFDLMLEDFEQLVNEWIDANGDQATDAIRIDGTRMGWESSDGYFLGKTKELLPALGLRGEWRLVFELAGTELSVQRYSHDEPTSASFKVSFIDTKDLDY